MLLLAIASSSQPACIKSYALGAVADAMSGSGGAYATDDDPELVGQAIPFGLKTMESVLVEQPKHRGLLTGLASGFVQYGYVFVDLEADRLGESDVDRGLELKKRARKLYLRARGYGMRGLDVAHPGFADAYAADPNGALAKTSKEDVPLLYWTAAAWGLAIGASKDDPAVFADLPLVGPLAKRALELDETWNRGTLHEFFISFETSTPEGSIDRARQHFARAVELSEGTRAGPFVTLAERVCVKEQNAGEFRELLQKALAIDVDRRPEDRLANVIMQRRARRLLERVGDLFLDAGDGS